MNQQWRKYRKNFDYAAKIEFSETCDAVLDLMNQIPKI